MKVLIAVDSNGIPQDALPKLYQLIERSATGVTVLLVDEGPAEPSQRREAELLSYLESIAHRLEGAGARIETGVRFGDYEVEVRAAAARGAYDLVWTLARRAPPAMGSTPRRAAATPQSGEPVTGDGGATPHWEVAAA
jgi:hypothetical protein